MAGYCYHFALMLQATFKRGNICIIVFEDGISGHIVWVDTNGISYDFEGIVYEYSLLADVSLLGDLISDFTRIGESANASKEEIQRMHKKIMKLSQKKHPLIFR